MLFRMAIIYEYVSLHVNVKTPFLLSFTQSNNPLLIQNPSKFRRLAWEGARGIRGGGIASSPPGYGPASVILGVLQ